MSLEKVSQEFQFYNKSVFLHRFYNNNSYLKIFCIFYNVPTVVEG